MALDLALVPDLVLGLALDLALVPDPGLDLVLDLALVPVLDLDLVLDPALAPVLALGQPVALELDLSDLLLNHHQHFHHHNVQHSHYSIRKYCSLYLSLGQYFLE